MADYFLQGLAAGAAIGNMRVQRQERMMELRAQEAQRAIQERQIAAQAQMLAEHANYYRAQAKQIEDEQLQEKADMLAARDLYYEQTEVAGKDPDEAHQHTISVMSFKNPTLAQKMALAYKTLKAANAEKAGFEPSVATLTGPDGRTVDVVRKSPNEVQVLPPQTPENLTAQPVMDASGNVITYAVPGSAGPRYVSPKAMGLGAVEKAEVTSIYKQIDRLQEQYDGMKDKKLFGQANAEKEALGAKIETLKRKAKAIERAKGVAPAPKATRVKVRDRAGKVFTVPTEQLEEAKAQGYEPVE